MLPKIRTRWKIGSQEGAGPWRGLSERAVMDAWAATMNATYGAGSHWVEEG
jgi:hypothetical protein